MMHSRGHGSFGRRVLPAVLGLACACSFTTVQRARPTERVEDPRTLDDSCTTSKRAPLVDVVTAGVTGIAGMVAAGIIWDDMTDGEGGQGGMLVAAPLMAPATVLLGSGIYGYTTTAQCRRRIAAGGRCAEGELDACLRLKPGWVPPEGWPSPAGRAPVREPPGAEEGTHPGSPGGPEEVAPVGPLPAREEAAAAAVVQPPRVASAGGERPEEGLTEEERVAAERARRRRDGAEAVSGEGGEPAAVAPPPSPLPAPLPAVVAPAPLPPRPPRPPLIPTFSFGLGATGSAGSVGGDLGATSDWWQRGAMLDVYMDGGARVTPHLALLLYVDVGVGEAAGVVEEYCAPRDFDCGVAAGRIGILGRYALTPSAPSTWWFAAGTGWESTDLTLTPPGYDLASEETQTLTFDGWEILKLGAGWDLRLSRWAGFGAFAYGSVATYSKVSSDGPEYLAPGELGGQRAHFWLLGGARFVLFP